MVEPVNDGPIVYVDPIVKEPIVPINVAAVAPVVPVADPIVPVVPAIQGIPSAVAEDPQLMLSDPIDRATKLIIDLDEHLRKYLPEIAEDKADPTTPAPVVYSGDVVQPVIAEEKAPVEDVPIADRQNQMTALIDQVNRLAESIEVSSYDGSYHCS